MSDKQHAEVIETYIENIKRYMQEAGGLFPHFTIFASKIDGEEDEKMSIIHIPIPSQNMETDKDKDFLVNDLLPIIYEKIKDEFIPYGVGWASEAWLRTTDKEEDVANYKDLPIRKEVLMVSVDTDFKSETIIYDIKRQGQQINSEGELVDIIQLDISEELSESMQSVGGRFVGLYNKLKSL